MTTRVRAMTEADCEAVGVLRVAGWRFAYAGLMPQSYLDALDPERDAALRRRLLTSGPATLRNAVAERHGRIAGWACWGPYREPRQEPAPPGADPAKATADLEKPPPDGELYALYVDPAQIATGLGRLLLQHCVTTCAEAGHPRLRLWVLAENLRARRFYERAGLTADGAEQVDLTDGFPVTEVRYTMTLA